MAAIYDITEDDWRLLREVRLRALQDAPKAFTSNYGDEAGHDERRWRERLRGSLWLLAFQDGTAAPPIGVIAATQETLAPATEPFISSLWVDPKHRRHGIARDLIEAAVGLVAARGAVAVSLWVLDDNDAAHRLYAAAGFVATGDRQLAPGSSNIHEQRLRRNLRLARTGRPGARASLGLPARSARPAGRIHLIM
jgi:ribosomal protein S18 acetylase RimI-like enzyme